MPTGQDCFDAWVAATEAAWAAWNSSSMDTAALAALKAALDAANDAAKDCLKLAHGIQ